MQTIKLVVKGQGHVPSFKNKKRAILDSRSGKMRTLTEPQVKNWMNQCQQRFESQLRYSYRTAESETLMGRSLQSWIACVMPRNDSVKYIIEETIRVVKVPKGQEGALIEISPAAETIG